MPARRSRLLLEQAPSQNYENMKKGILNFTIPTLTGILLLVAGMAVGLYLVKSGQLPVGKADPKLAPKNVTITNIDSDSFTVSWVTEIPTIGVIRFGQEEKLDHVASDSRDQLSQDTKNYTTHYVNVDNLKPQSLYFFKIGSGGQSFQVTTAPALDKQPPTDIIYGQVVGGDKKPAEGAIVYLQVASSSPVSALVGKDGMWAKPLQTTRTTDLSAYVSYNLESSVLKVTASQGLEKNLNSQIMVTCKNDKPVPTIVLGQDQDYRAQEETNQLAEQNVVTPEENATPSSEGFGSLTSEENNVSTTTLLNITNPALDGEKINTPKPLFLGKGPAKKVLTVKIESPQTYTGTVRVDETGNWQYSPAADLNPGEHKITASYIDDQGQEQKIARQFVVLAAGTSELPAFESSPSASVKPSPLPSPLPTVPPRISLPSTASGVPTSGTAGPTMVVFIGGFLFLLLGFYLQKSWK